MTYIGIARGVDHYAPADLHQAPLAIDDDAGYAPAIHEYVGAETMV